jgi:hypothetical protein
MDGVYMSMYIFVVLLYYTAQLAALIFYCAAIAVASIWLSLKYPVWFGTFLAIVASQTMLFGGIYVYEGHWDSSLNIVVAFSSVTCIITSVVVAFFFLGRRANVTTDAHT